MGRSIGCRRQSYPTLESAKDARTHYSPECEATQFGGLLSADYTFEGLRAWKQNGTTGVRTYFLYDGTTPVLELTATGSVQAVNTFGANGLVSRSTSTGSTFYVFDERGNTSVRLDAAGSVLSSHAADAFGGTLALPTGGGSDDPYAGYGAQWGYYRDAETGLYLCTFRYYDATEGRWLTPDPIGYAGGVNVYGYVKNGPLTFIDPLGLDAFDNATRTIFTVGGALIGGFSAGAGGGTISFGVLAIPSAAAGAAGGAIAGATTAEAYIRLKYGLLHMMSSQRGSSGGGGNSQANGGELRGIRSLFGRSQSQVLRAAPKNWCRQPAARGNGWKLVDPNGVERVRFMRPQDILEKVDWARQRMGYWRWKNAANEFLDEYGNVVSESNPNFNELTHIPYSGR